MSEAPSDANASGDTVARWHRFYLEKLPVIPSDRDLEYQIEDWNSKMIHHRSGVIAQLFYVHPQKLLDQHGQYFLVNREMVVDLDDWA